MLALVCITCAGSIEEKEDALAKRVSLALQSFLTEYQVDLYLQIYQSFPLTQLARNTPHFDSLHYPQTHVMLPLVCIT